MSGRHLAILVALQNVDLPLQLIVLPVQEVNLALQFDDALFVLLILILQVYLLHILHWQVQVVQSEYFVVAYFDLALQVLNDLLVFNNPPLHFLHYLVQLLASLVGSAHLLGPLILLWQQILLHLHSKRGRSDILEAVGFKAALLHRR